MTKDTVEEIMGAFHDKFVMESSYPDVQCLNTENPYEVKTWLRTTFTKALEDAKREERERIAKLFDNPTLVEAVEDIAVFICEDMKVAREIIDKYFSPKEVTYAEMLPKDTRNAVVSALQEIVTES